MQEFVVSLEAVEAMPGVVAVGFAVGVLVVSGVSVIASAFKTFFKIAGGR